MIDISKYIHENISSSIIEHLNETMCKTDCEIAIFEGGQGGHMHHPFDYVDFTCNDLVDLVDSLFNGKIEHMKEKLDGFNIFATMNEYDEVRFIRNPSNMNSERGGMSIDDMIEKWAEREHQKKVFVQSGEIITKIFEKLGKKYFNPDSETRKCINCECIIAGKTNIMPYATDMVAFHGYSTYKKENDKWVLKEDVEGHVEDVYAAAEGLEYAKPRQDLVIKSVEQAHKAGEKFKKELNKLWEKEGISLSSTVDDWKRARFKKYAPEWMKDDNDIYERLMNDNKSTNLTILKKRYPDHKEEMAELDKKIKKQICKDVCSPIDSLFLSIGNELIDLLDGFINSKTKDATVTSLKNDIANTVSMIETSGTEDEKQKLMNSLERLKMLDDKYNAAEGVVLVYNGRRMKLTGSFAPINQILGLRFNHEK